MPADGEGASSKELNHGRASGEGAVVGRERRQGGKGKEVEDARQQTTTQIAAVKEELPEADEFGLPIRPSRRRVYEEEEDGEEDMASDHGKPVIKEREIPSDIPAADK